MQTTASPRKDGTQQLSKTEMANASVSSLRGKSSPQTNMANDRMTTAWPCRHIRTQPRRHTGTQAQRLTHTEHPCTQIAGGACSLEHGLAPIGGDGRAPPHALALQRIFLNVFYDISKNFWEGNALALNV